MVPVDFLRRLFAGIRKPHPNMNSCSTKCLRLLQAKEMSLVKSRSWFSQPWTVTMCVYLLMDKRAQEKLSPWRETTEIMRQREWSHGPWNKCFGHPKTSEKKVGRWEMVRCFCLCDLSLKKKKKHNLIDPIICIKLWTEKWNMEKICLEAYGSSNIFLWLAIFRAARNTFSLSFFFSCT